MVALIVNVTGIQSYIFHSNKLRDNIGASYIIEHLVYGEVMQSVVNKLFGEIDINAWRDNPDTITIDDPKTPCEVGYIGGGNALLFFQDEAKCTSFVREFSEAILCHFPGLQLVFGKKIGFDLSNYKAEYEKLMKDLKIRKSAAGVLSSVPKYGITADCPWSNDAAETWFEKDNIYISSSSKARFDAAGVVSQKAKQTEQYQCLGKTKYELTDDIEKLGQEKEGSYIAVVHIDGNGMGKVFSQLDNLVKLRKKSKLVSEKAQSAMGDLLADLIRLAEDESKPKRGDIDDLSFFDHKYLPIRPILVGGDDITFICEGRLGMYLAEKFIALFYNKRQRELKGEENAEDYLMSGACAGVAIVKTHFPFYKAVHLAEELCQEAKKQSREDGNCYISFYYSATTFSGSLKDLRKRTHLTPDGKELYFGPYVLFDKEQPNSIEKLKAGIQRFYSQFPRNKVMHLREVMSQPEAEIQLFEAELKAWGLQLPEGKKEIWDDKKKSPYFDQIELMDFYLPTLLSETIE